MSYLGIDLGTTSLKAVLVSVSGEVLREGTASYAMQHPYPGAAVQDPEHWWRATRDAVQQIQNGLGAEINTIGLSGQMHGTVCLNSMRQLIRPALIWPDTRGTITAAELTAVVGEMRLSDTIGTPLASGFQGVTVAWLRQHEPTTWRSIATVLLPKDYLRFRLTGEIATDPSDAAGTGMLDVHTRDWSDLMLDTVGLDRGKVPAIRPSAQIAGRLTSEAAEYLGLPVGLPVVTGGGDAPLAALASGVADGRSLLATLSSGAQVIAFTDHPAVDPRLRVHTFAAPLDPTKDEAGWYVMGATMVAGMALSWLKENIFESSSDQAITSMVQRASEISPGSNGLLFAPYLTGERTPHLDSRARGAFLGLTADHDRRHLTRAAMEGVVFALRDALDVVRSLTRTGHDVVLAGGGSRSPLWRQIMADIFEMPVRPSLIVDQSAIGAALLAAACDLGTTASSLGKEWARVDRSVEPVPANMIRYEELRGIFRDIYPAHAAHFHRLSEFD